ncbi:MAG TPA: zinc-ribbon domain-containing protein, partial [Burkholderiaceae bacterium]|nr:zinc-ribbon domain-containing protein [Burkholderiaceae bacterium]
MSLATRCPVCQTVFRVVQDQLKVSEGWVRCGRCAKVFNAFEGLFDLEREFPATRQPSPSQRVLEDLATRNPQPKPSTWDDEFEGTVRAPPPGPPTRPAARAPA